MTFQTPTNNYAQSVGSSSTAPFITIIQPFAPTPNDGPQQGYLVGQRWVDSTDNHEYFLLGYVSTGGVVQANWVQLSAGSSIIQELQGNSGPPVVPTAGVINVVGDASGIQTAGSGSTLTATLANIPNSSLAHSDITLIAGAGISITVSPVPLGGSTTISATGTGEVQTLTGNSGGAVPPTAGNINVVGDGTSVVISGNPGTSTLTASAGGSVATTYDGNSGSAVPSAGVLNIVGTGSISTSATGNTVTIAGSAGSGFSSINLRVFDTPGTAVYTPTLNTQFVQVEVLGGGGGGGGSSGVAGGNTSQGGGGGAGGYSKSILPIASATGQTYIVGAAGSGGSAGNNIGGDGGDSSFAATLIGGGGFGGQGCASVQLFDTFGGGGGVGSGGQFNTTGMPGGCGVMIGASAVGGLGYASNSGFGGSTLYGGGAVATNGASQPANPATSYGGGGAGSSSQSPNSGASAGGNGFSGVVTVTEFIS